VHVSGWGIEQISIRLGTNPIAWSNDDLQELGGATPLETCLREAREAGLQGDRDGPQVPHEPQRLREVLAARLDLVSGWHSSALLRRGAAAEIAAMRPHLDLLKALDPTSAQPLWYARMGCENLRRWRGCKRDG
jgi:inosose dehydratase